MWQEHFKDKETAIVHIFDCLAENPGVAGADGTLTVIFRGKMITIRPPKKKSKEE